LILISKKYVVIYMQDVHEMFVAYEDLGSLIGGTDPRGDDA
jgi:hypothetical protein